MQCNCRNGVEWGLLTGICLHVICIIILGSVPPISRDALIHHLTIPKMYLHHGGIYEIPSMHFSYFPMNLDLLYILPLYFKKAFAAKYVHFLFALLTAGLLYRYLKKRLGHVYGLTGALFFLTIPVIVKLSVTVYVDLGLIFFSWACLYFFLEWYDSRFNHRFLIFSAISCGLALGTKYNALILLLIMSAMVPLAYSLKRNKTISENERGQRYRNSFKGIMLGILFLLVALLLFSPWMLRNMVWKQNPIYPLYNGLFNPPVHNESVDSTKEKSPPKNAFWMRRHVYKESFAQTLLIPVRMFYQGRDDNPRYFDGKLNVFLLLLPLLSFVRPRGSPLAELTFHQLVFVLFAVLFSLFVLFKADFRIRYMAPAIPPLVVLSIFGLHNMVTIVSRQAGLIQQAGWITIAGAVTILFGLNAFYIIHQFDYIKPLQYLSGTVGRDAYITRYRREHAAIVRANQTLPEDARVLCLSIGDRIFYLDRPAHLAEDFYTKKNATYHEDDLLKKMARYETTHILIDTYVLFNWMKHQTPAERSAFTRVFQNNTRTLFEENGVRLLEFLPADLSGKGSILTAPDVSEG